MNIALGGGVVSSLPSIPGGSSAAPNSQGCEGSSLQSHPPRALPAVDNSVP